MTNYLKLMFEISLQSKMIEHFKRNPHKCRPKILLIIETRKEFPIP